MALANVMGATTARWVSPFRLFRTSLRDAFDNLEKVPVATGIVTYKGMNRVPLRVVALNPIVGGQKTHVADVIPDAADVPPAN